MDTACMGFMGCVLRVVCAVGMGSNWWDNVQCRVEGNPRLWVGCKGVVGYRKAITAEAHATPGNGMRKYSKLHTS